VEIKILQVILTPFHSLRMLISSVKSNSNVFPFSCPFRSPWSNSYDPPLDDGAVPSDRLRKLEMEANSAFDQYREM